MIYDRYGEPLVKNAVAHNIILIPSDLPRSAEEKRQVIKMLAGALKISEETVKNYSDRRRFEKIQQRFNQSRR